MGTSPKTVAPRRPPVTARGVAQALARLARAQRDVADALDALAVAHAGPQADPTELVPHTAWPWSRRVACRLARTGQIRARRSGKTWIATRADLDAYLATCPDGAREVDDAADDTSPPSVASIMRAVRAPLMQTG